MNPEKTPTGIWVRWGLFFLVGITLVLLGVFAHSNYEKDDLEENTTNKQEHIQLAQTFITSLGIAEEVQDVVSSPFESQDEVGQLQELLNDSRRAVVKLENASQLFAPYISSPDKKVREISQLLTTSYKAISILVERSATDVEQLMRAESNDELIDFMSASSKTRAQLDEAWKQLPAIGVVVTYLLLDLDSSETGQLLITESEREELKREVVEIFGEEIKYGAKEGQFAPTVAAALFYEFLNQEGWETAQE